MSRVIERVYPEYQEWEEEHVSCDKCGCGNTKDLTEKPCPQPDCNGYWRRKTIQLFNIIPGYVIVECDCGEEIYCDSFTNTCECGADYNWSGQRLASREQWGEETGESISDILGPAKKDEW